MINIWIINGVGDDHHEPNHPGIQCKLWKQYLWKKVYFASLGFKPETFSFPGIETFYQWLHFLLLKMNYMLKEMLTMMLKMMLGFELKLMMRFRCMLACCRCCQWNLGRSKTFKDIFLKSKWFSFYCLLKKDTPSTWIEEDRRICLAHLWWCHCDILLSHKLWHVPCGEGATLFSVAGREDSTVYSLPTISFTFKKYFRNFEYISQGCLDALGVCSATLFQIRTRQTIPYNQRP